MAVDLTVLQLAIEVGYALTKRWLSTPERCEGIRRLARPPGDVLVVSRDGCLYTGVLLVADNVPVVMLAVRHGPPRDRTADLAPGLDALSY